MSRVRNQCSPFTMQVTCKAHVSVDLIREATDVHATHIGSGRNFWNQIVIIDDTKASNSATFLEVLMCR